MLMVMTIFHVDGGPIFGFEKVLSMMGTELIDNATRPLQVILRHFTKI